LIEIKYSYADWGCDNPMDYMTEIVILINDELVYGEILK